MHTIKAERRGHMGDLYIHGSIVLRADLKGVLCALHSLAQNRDQWVAAVNVVINYPVSTGDRQFLHYLSDC
jgi:hypothetical protein